MAKPEKKENVEVEFTPEQKRFQTSFNRKYERSN